MQLGKLVKRKTTRDRRDLLALLYRNAEDSHHPDAGRDTETLV